jgi:hypothetical protein
MSLIPFTNAFAEALKHYPDEPGMLTRERAAKSIQQALSRPPDAPPDPASGAHELHVEAWQCDRCGEKVPCRVEVVYTKTPFHDDDSDPRFSARRCICETGHVPYWIQTPRTD